MIAYNLPCAIQHQVGREDTTQACMTHDCMVCAGQSPMSPELCVITGTSQYFDGDDKGAAGLAGDSEMYPYVSFTISVDG